MRVLLDTHVFLWFITGDAKLPDSLRDCIRDPGNEIYLSVVSIWEASIKYRLGKLPLQEPPGKYLPRQRERHGIAGLAMGEGAIAHLDELPLLHRDPFDRMLICQAKEHGLTLATVDDSVKAYPISVYKT